MSLLPAGGAPSPLVYFWGGLPPPAPLSPTIGRGAASAEPGQEAPPGRATVALHVQPEPVLGRPQGPRAEGAAEAPQKRCPGAVAPEHREGIKATQRVWLQVKDAEGQGGHLALGDLGDIGGVTTRPLGSWGMMGILGTLGVSSPPGSQGLGRTWGLWGDTTWPSDDTLGCHHLVFMGLGGHGDIEGP